MNSKRLLHGHVSQPHPRMGAAGLRRVVAGFMLGAYLVTGLVSPDTFSALNSQLSIPAASAAAGINPVIHYQGKISLLAGSAVGNGTYNMRFKIYDALSSGNLLWSETWSNATTRVTMTGGLFSVGLGTHVTMTGSVNFNTDNLYLQVEFDPGNDGVYEEVFAPRRRFASVPYAHNTDTLDGVDSTNFLRKDAVNVMTGSIISRSTISGAVIHASNALTTSGALTVKGAVKFKNYTTCAIINTDSSGNLGCASSITVSTGSVIAITDGKYVKKGGDTMTGALVINVTGGSQNTLGLRVINTASGAVFHAEKSLTSSGTLVWEGAGSGSSLTLGTLTMNKGVVGLPSISFFNDSDTGIYQSAANTLSFAMGGVESVRITATNFQIQANAAAGSPSLSTVADVNTGLRFPADDSIVFVNNGTDRAAFDSNGQLGIGTISPKAKLDVVGTLSGTLLTLSSMRTCTLKTSASGNVICGSDNTGAGGSFGTGNVVTIGDSKYVNIGGDTMTGVLIIQNGNTHSPTATPLLNVRGTISGALLTISSNSSFSNGNITMGSTGSTIFNVNNTNVDFHIAGIKNPNLFVVRATSGTSSLVTGSGAIGINTNTPWAPFTVAPKLPSGKLSTITTSLSGPNTVYVQGNYAYVTNSSSNNLSIFDISNPSIPVLVTTTSSGGMISPNSVVVQGRYAYVASATSNQLIILDISNPVVPKFVGSTTSGLNVPAFIAVQGNYVYLTNTTNNALVAFDVSNPTNPVKMSSITTGLSSPHAIVIQGQYAYVSSFSNSTFAIFDISNPAKMALVGSSTSGLSGARGVYVQGRYAYVTSQNTSKLSVFDINNPNAPTVVGSTTTGVSSPRSVYVQGRYAYVANASATNTTGNMSIFDISDPTNPTFLGFVRDGMKSPRGISVQGRYAYLTDFNSNALTVVDLGGAYIQNMEVGSLAAGSLSLQNNISAVDGNFFGGIVVNGGFQAQRGSSIFNTATGASAYGLTIVSNTGALRLSVNGNGASALAPNIQFGSGSTFDTNLYRSAIATLRTSGNFIVQNTISGSLLVLSNLHNCTLSASATGAIICGAAGSSTPEVGTLSFSGAVVRLGNTQWVKKSGDTMTGSLVINPTSGLALNTRGTISGALITQNGSGSNYFLGNLGIGTTSPNMKLVVTETAASVFPMQINGTHVGTAITNTMGPIIANTDSTTGNWAGLLFSDAAGGAASALMGVKFTDHTNNYGDFAIATRSAAGFTEKMRILSTGEVGIGKTAPSTKLEVVGTISGSLITQNGAGNNYFMGNVGVGTTGPLYELHVADPTGDAIMYAVGGTPSTTAGTGYLILGSSRTNTAVGHIVKIASSAVAAGQADMVFYTQSSNGVTPERMRITNNGLVGIGTTTPGSRLSVSGAVVISNNGNLGSSTAKATLDVKGTISGSLITQNGSGSNYFLGNLGIGTTSISDVNGTNKLRIVGTPNTDIVSISDGVAALGIYIKNDSAVAPTQFGTTTNHALGFFTNNQSPLMTLSVSKNVGIGIVTPKARLTVVGSGSFTGTISGATLSLNGTGVTTLMNYKVGIGTTTPRSTLAVVGEITSQRNDTTGEGGFRFYQAGGTSNANMFTMQWGSTVPLQIAHREDLDQQLFYFRDTLIFNEGGANFAGGTNVMALSGGNVGIGTLTPHTNTKLEVVGSMSGSLLTLSSMRNCTLKTSSSGNVICGSDNTGAAGSAWSSTGAILTAADSKYVNIGGDTMTGALTINVRGGTDRTIGLNVLNTISGSYIHAEKGLSSSGTLMVEAASGSTNIAYFKTYNSNGYSQINVQNLSNSTSASSDIVATSDIGTETKYYIDLGINSSTYNNPAYTITKPNDGYLYTSDSNLAIGTGSGKALIFHTNGTLAANERMRISSGGYVGIGTATPMSLLSVGSGSAFRVNASGSLGIGIAPTRNQAINVAYSQPANTYGSAVDLQNTWTPTSSSALFAYGLNAISTNMGNANLTLPTGGVVGAAGTARNLGGTSNSITLMIGLLGKIENLNTGTVIGAASLSAASPSAIAGPITNAYGLYINQQRTTGVVNAYGIYQTDSGDNNYFAGRLGIGTTTPKAKLTVFGSGAFTGTLSGSALNIQGNNSYIMGRLGIGSTAAPDTPLDVLGTISGSRLHASNSITTSGSITIESLQKIGSGALSVYTQEYQTGAVIFGSGGAAALAINTYAQTGAGIKFGFRGIYDVELYRGGSTRTVGSNSGGLVLRVQSRIARTSAFSIVSNFSAVNNTVFRVTASGGVLADGKYATSGADYAEWFYTKEVIPAGEVVCIDVTKPNTVKRCERDADSNVMGITSTNPAFVGNQIGGADGIDPPGYSLVGLIGQVPAKVIVESDADAIHPGDSLTAASKPGYARKAKAGESTVGVALEGLESGEGKVNVLISRRNSSMTVDAVGDKVLQTIADMKIEDEVQLMVSSALGDLNVDEQITDEVTKQIDAITAQNATIESITFEINRLKEEISALRSSTGSIQSIAGTGAMHGASTSTSMHASALEIDDTLITGGDARIGGDLSIDGTLNASSLFVPNGLTIDGGVTMNGVLDAMQLHVSSGATVDGVLTINGRLNLGSGAHINLGSGALTMDQLIVENALFVMGDITVKGMATFLGDINVKGELTVSNKFAGFAMIPKSGTSVTIFFGSGFKATPIVSVTPQDFVFAAWRTFPVTQTGFTIELSAPTDDDIVFSWFAIGVGNPVELNRDLTEDGTIIFPTDEKGVPVSSNMAWNACIRNITMLDGDGQPLSCARYHDAYTWTHPDLNITFIWNTSVTPALLQLPAGYEARIMEESQTILDAINGVGDEDETASTGTGGTTETGSIVPEETPVIEEEPIVEEEPVIETPVEETPAGEPTPEPEPEPTPTEEPAVEPQA